ncbi:MAG TPA: hypothetical protein VF381_12560, partial [Thermoanaerobaculia bacterium]
MGTHDRSKGAQAPSHPGVPSEVEWRGICLAIPRIRNQEPTSSRRRIAHQQESRFRVLGALDDNVLK